jgi:hypothetical protein
MALEGDQFLGDRSPPLRVALAAVAGWAAPDTRPSLPRLPGACLRSGAGHPPPDDATRCAGASARRRRLRAKSGPNRAPIAGRSGWRRRNRAQPGVQFLDVTVAQLEPGIEEARVAAARLGRGPSAVPLSQARNLAQPSGFRQSDQHHVHEVVCCQGHRVWPLDRAEPDDIYPRRFRQAGDGTHSME